MKNNARKGHQIASRCRVARENSGLSQAQAAKKLGMARSTLTEAEAGNRKISATELSQMASIYAVSVSWLADESEDAPGPERDRIELAARELSQLRREDLDTVLQLVRSIRANPRGRP